MQFLPVVDGQGQEKELVQKVLKDVLAKHDFDGLDINKVGYSILHWSFYFPHWYLNTYMMDVIVARDIRCLLSVIDVIMR